MSLANYHLRPMRFDETSLQPVYKVNLYIWRGNEWALAGILDLRPEELGKLSRIFQAHEATYGRDLPTRIA